MCLKKNEVAQKKNVFGMLFSKPYAKGTVLLWVTYFMGLVDLPAHQLVTNFNA
jgi:hypothetical protein